MSHFGIGSIWFRLESASFTDGMSKCHSSGVNHFEHEFFGPESFWPTVISIIYLHGRYPTTPLVYLPTTHRPTMPVL